MRLFFTTDIHGSEPCFRKFLNAARVYGADVLVLGGDVTGKGLVPVVEHPDGTISSGYLGEERPIPPDGIEQFLKDIRFSGYYPYRCTPEGREALKGDFREIFVRLTIEELHRWLRLAEERLAGTGVLCFVSLGNDDFPEAAEAFEGVKGVVNPEGRVVELPGGLTMVSDGFSNPTPFNSARETDEETLFARLDRPMRQVPSPEKCVANLHCPPSDTPLDLAPKLTPDKRPVVSGGDLVMEHVGSTAVRKIVETYGPLVGLFGHIHESKAACRVGRTLCLNPGSEYGQGVLRGVMVNVDNRGRVNHGFTSG